MRVDFTNPTPSISPHPASPTPCDSFHKPRLLHRLNGTARFFSLFPLFCLSLIAPFSDTAKVIARSLRIRRALSGSHSNCGQFPPQSGNKAIPEAYPRRPQAVVNDRPLRAPFHDGLFGPTIWLTASAERRRSRITPPEPPRSRTATRRARSFMRQAAIITPTILVLLGLAGTWITPRLSDAEDLATVRPVTIPSTQNSAPKVSDFKAMKGAEGFWRIGQAPSGVWWFVSPSNQAEFLNTVTTVQPYQHARDKDGPSYISHDYDGGLAPEGNLDAWAAKTLARVKETGFKGIGAWSHPVLHKHEVPITRDLNVWTWMHGPSRRFYHPDFAATADKAIKAQVEPLKDNKSLVGYFIDNELDWGDATSGPAAYFDQLAHNDPNRAEVMKVIQTVWATVDQFNKDWQAKVANWDDLHKWNALPRHGHSQQPYSRLYSAWLSHLAEDYFRLTTQLIRKYDRNHLILGVRFKGHAIREVVRASRGYTDVQSINYYPADARLDAEMFRMMHEESGQPIMLSEYSFHSLDGRSGNRNTIGFGAQVLDQQARADGYRIFTTNLARVPFIVGADWFQWNDEPPSGRINDGEDANFGVVDIDDSPYDALVDSVRKTTPLLNGIHDAAHKDDGNDVWRESFASKPTHSVPFLEKKPRINGEVSDWPKSRSEERRVGKECRSRWSTYH